MSKVSEQAQSTVSREVRKISCGPFKALVHEKYNPFIFYVPQPVSPETMVTGLFFTVRTISF
jgi:hypothetical protein